MQKIKKLFQFLGIILSHPSRINILLEDNAYQKQLFSRHYPEKIKGLPLIQLQNIVGKEIHIDCMSLLDGGSLPTDLGLLMGLARNIPDCDYFELGTWRGESVVNVSKYAKYCTTFNLSTEALRKIGASEEYISQVGMFLNKKNNINFIRGNSHTYDFRQMNKRFDLIFIDADHHYKSVYTDTRSVFKHLKKENSVVVWHDYTFAPDKIRYEVYRAILDAIPKAEQRYLFHVKNTNCAVFIKKEFETSTLNYPMFPEATFEINIQMHNNVKSRPN